MITSYSLRHSLIIAWLLPVLVNLMVIATAYLFDLGLGLQANYIMFTLFEAYLCVCF